MAVGLQMISGCISRGEGSVVFIVQGGADSPCVCDRWRMCASILVTEWVLGLERSGDLHRLLGTVIGRSWPVLPHINSFLGPTHPSPTSPEPHFPLTNVSHINLYLAFNPCRPTDTIWSKNVVGKQLVQGPGSCKSSHHQLASPHGLTRALTLAISGPLMTTETVWWMSKGFAKRPPTWSP